MIKKEVIMYKVMTPGPTQVKENVRMARSLVCTNPDLDEDFVEFYKDTCELIMIISMRPLFTVTLQAVCSIR